MRRTVLLLGLTLVVAIAVGVLGNQLLNAAQDPVKRTELLKADLEGKDAVINNVELAPGAASGKHYHPGHEFVYLLEGSGTLEVEGKPPSTVKAGETFHLMPKQVHNVKNTSTTAPLKALVFAVFEKGQPPVTPVQ